MLTLTVSFAIIFAPTLTRQERLAQDLQKPALAASSECLELEALPECATRLTQLGLSHSAISAQLVDQACWRTVDQADSPCGPDGLLPLSE